jgi:two-component system, NtrC family, sensor histidine kinase KinB
MTLAVNSQLHRQEVADILSDVARTINATLDLPNVLALILEHLARLVRYDSASILLLEDDRLRVVAARGFADPDSIIDLSFDAQHGMAARVVREKRCLLLEDVSESPEWAPLDLPESQSIRSWIGAPLIVQAEAIGLLSVDSHQGQAYAEPTAQVVAAFAAQTATAVVNARLYAESQRRLQAMQALAMTAHAISSTLNLDQVLRLLAQHAFKLLEVEAASIGLVEGERLVYREAAGAAAEQVKGSSIELGQGIAGWVAANNQPALVPEVMADPRFYPSMDQKTGYNTRAIASVPIAIQARVIGIIEAINPLKGRFDSEAINLLTSLASLAGTAIVHAQWFAELQAAESRFAGLFEDSIDPLLITDLNGIITNANRKALEFFGYRRSELLGLRVSAVHRTGTAWLGSERFRELQSGEEITYETRITTKPGSEIPVEVHAKRIQRGDQEFIQWIQHDLSERVALEELRNDLVNMIVHDLRNPLGNILSALDILEMSLPSGDAGLASVLATANRSVTRLSQLVDSLLDLRRLEAGKVLLNKDQINVTTLVTEAVEQVQPNAEGKGIELHAELPPRLPFVSIDADMIRRVMINLMDNSVKYMMDPGSITVTAKADPSEVTLSIQDTGPGIPATVQSRIFDKFVRGQREFAAPKGAGLGLAFCKLAVEAHGGRIWVDSQLGKGATFNFTLPI